VSKVAQSTDLGMFERRGRTTHPHHMHPDWARHCERNRVYGRLDQPSEDDSVQQAP
jgi:hypothetical protein